MIFSDNIVQGSERRDERNYMKKKNDINDEYLNDDEQDVLQELLGALDRTHEARIKDSSDEEAKYIQLYGKNVSYYLLQGCIVNAVLYFNRGPEGINGPYKHFPRPLRFIDLIEVGKFFEENDESPDEKDWEDFEQSIDENAERFETVYEDEKIRYLSYFRYETGEYCYYDIFDRKLVETGLIYEMSFRDENNEVCGKSEDYLIMQMDKVANSFVYDIIYNPNEKKYGLIMGHEIIYDIDWLKDYTSYRLEESSDRVGRLLYRYRRRDLSEKDFVSIGVKKLDLMLRFIRDVVDGDIKAPKGLLDEMFDEYMNLFDYVTDAFKK